MSQSCLQLPKRGSNAGEAPVAPSPDGQASLSTLHDASKLNNSCSEKERINIKLCWRCERTDFSRVKTCTIFRSLRSAILTPNCQLCEFFEAWFRQDYRNRNFTIDRDRDINHCAVMVLKVESDYENLFPTYGLTGLRLGLFGRGRSPFGRQVLLADSSATTPESRQDLRFLSRDTRVDFAILREWLSFCQKHHMETCVAGKQILVPNLMAIDCTLREVVFYRDSIDGWNDGYVTLSYMWGPTSGQQRLSEDSQLPNPIPPLIKDAMRVTQNLGFRYLWIDRYCIPQDNPAERYSQIRAMGRIYAASAVTIIAVAGDGPHHGLTGISVKRETAQLRVRVGDNVLIHQLADPKDQVLHSKWNFRAWTYQEAILSRRRLIFTQDQVFFHCQSMCCLESIVHFPLQHQPRTDPNRFEHFNSWLHCPPSVDIQPLSLLSRITEYFPRSLSFDSDTIYALSGVYEWYKAVGIPVFMVCGLPIFSPSTYGTLQEVLGLNEARLILALCWTSNLDLCRRHMFPSWTWAGWKVKPENRTLYFSKLVLRFPHLTDLEEGSRDVTLQFPVKITAQLPEGDQLDWELHCDKLLELSEKGIYPSFLQITGWSFNFTIEIHQRSTELISPWSASDKPWLDHLTELITRRQPGKIMGDLEVRRKLSDDWEVMGESMTVRYELTALVLYQELNSRGKKIRTGFLALISQGNPLIYERLDYVTLFDAPFVVPVDADGQDWETPFLMKYREIWLR